MCEKKSQTKKEKKMKTLKIVHNVFSVVALIAAMYIGGGIDATCGEILCSQMMFICIVALLAIRFAYEERKQKKDSL